MNAKIHLLDGLVALGTVLLGASMILVEDLPTYVILLGLCGGAGVIAAYISPIIFRPTFSDSRADVTVANTGIAVLFGPIVCYVWLHFYPTLIPVSALASTTGAIFGLIGIQFARVLGPKCVDTLLSLDLRAVIARVLGLRADESVEKRYLLLLDDNIQNLAELRNAAWPVAQELHLELAEARSLDEAKLYAGKVGRMIVDWYLYPVNGIMTDSMNAGIMTTFIRLMRVPTVVVTSSPEPVTPVLPPGVVLIEKTGLWAKAAADAVKSATV